MYSRLCFRSLMNQEQKLKVPVSLSNLVHAVYHVKKLVATGVRNPERRSLIRIPIAIGSRTPAAGARYVYP